MADKLERLQRLEREAKDAQDKAHKEALEAAKKAAAVVRKAKEEKWKALGEIVDKAGLGDLAPEVLRQVLTVKANGSTTEAAQAQADEGRQALEATQDIAEPAGASGRRWGGGRES